MIEQQRKMMLKLRNTETLRCVQRTIRVNGLQPLIDHLILSIAQVKSVLLKDELSGLRIHLLEVAFGRGTDKPRPCEVACT